MAQIVGVASQNGVRRVRLNGGEPRVPGDVLEVAAGLAALPGIEEISLTTNRLLLVIKVADLASAGMQRVNVSLDSLDPEKFRRITHCGRLERVFQVITAANNAG